MTDNRPDTRITSSAPGKLVLSGEYAVLDGAPAVCMAVNRRARVTVASAGGDRHTVIAPGYSSARGEFTERDGEFEWLAGGGQFRLVEEVWRAVDARPTESLSLALDTSDFFDAASGAKIGIGSSAALTVALVAALCERAQPNAESTAVAYAAHRQLQGGRGSGADIACSRAGGLIEFHMADAACLRLSWPDRLAFGLCWSGVPANTGRKLCQLKRRPVQQSRAALVDSAVRLAGAWRSGSAQSILNHYWDYTKILREFDNDHELGIFDAGHAKLADVAAAAGLVYKPCGAGGGDVGVVFGDDDAAVVRFCTDAVPAEFLVLDMSVDPLGVQVDREKH